jgi:uncharacterized Tic20 family protein
MAMRSLHDEHLMLAPLSGAERAAATACHGAVFLGMPFLLPFAIWLLFPLLGEPSTYVRHQAVQAMLFHVLVTVVGSAFFVAVVIAFFGSIAASALASTFTRWLHMAWPVTFAVLIAGGLFLAWATIIMLIATWKAAVGRPYRMPLVGGFGAEL